MKKIKWLNVIKLLVFIISALIGLYMSVIFVINGLSWFGIYLLIMSYCTAGSIYSNFKEETEKMSATRTSQHLKKIS